MDESNKAVDATTAEELLTKTICRLREDDDTDTALLEILAEYIVTINPKQNAVEQAASAIEGLAKNKAQGM